MKGGRNWRRFDHQVGTAGSESGLLKHAVCVFASAQMTRFTTDTQHRCVIGCFRQAKTPREGLKFWSGSLIGTLIAVPKRRILVSKKIGHHKVQVYRRIVIRIGKLTAEIRQPQRVC